MLKRIATWVLIITFVLTLAILGWKLSCIKTHFNPRIYCKEPIFNFGTKDSMDSVEHEFVFKNTGQKLLVILGIKKTCSCSMVDTSRLEILPGESKSIKVRMSLKGKTRKVSQPLIVKSNDPKNEEITVRIEGDVVETMSIVPSTILLGSFPSHEKQTAKVEISTLGMQNNYNILDAYSNLPFFKVDYAKNGPAGYSYMLTVTSDPNYFPPPQGHLQGTVSILTDDELHPQITIPLQCNVIGDIGVWPEEVVIYRGFSAVRYINIWPGNIDKFTIESISVPSSNINVKQIDLGENGYRIQLSNISDADELEGKTVNISIDAESVKEIKIPIKVIEGFNGIDNNLLRL